MYYIIQIAYFKTNHLFFCFGWDDVPDDCSFVLIRYFLGESLPDKLPCKRECYAQREKICALMVTARGHRHCLRRLNNKLSDCSPRCYSQLCCHGVEHLAQRAQNHPIRLYHISGAGKPDATIDGLTALIERDDTLSQLATLHAKPATSCRHCISLSRICFTTPAWQISIPFMISVN